MSSTGAAPKGPTAASSNNKLKPGPDTKKVNSLKRPGSPNLSEFESSGNESSRKKVKKTVPGSVRGQDSRSSTPVQSQRPKKMGGAASDGEATGTEMSDGGRKLHKKKKISLASHSRGTPLGSRAGSPVPGASQAASGKQSSHINTVALRLMHCSCLKVILVIT